MFSCTYYLSDDMTFFKHNCGQISELKVKIVLFFLNIHIDFFFLKIFTKLVFVFFLLNFLNPRLPNMILKINLKTIFINYGFKVNVKLHSPTAVLR